MCQNSRGDYSKVHAETITESQDGELLGGDLKSIPFVKCGSLKPT